MTSQGTLYVDEDCRDYFEKELNEWFGNDWYLNGDDYADYNLSQMPEKIKVDVINNNDDIIGEVEITNEFYIEDNGERYIEIKPKSIEKLK